MKDIFIPIILFITTIISAVFFLNNVYQPQQETLDVLAENSQSSSFAVTYVSEGNNETVSGAVVKSTIDYYSVDKDKEVCVRKGASTTTFINNKYDEGPDAGGSIVINNNEKYIREVVRNSESKEIERVWFVEK